MTEYLWGRKSKVAYLLIATVLLLITMLGARELWTQEHRWADIVYGMFYRHDFLHPYLGENDYYDKPLLSYWLIAAISIVTGHLSTWAMRLPSALAGVLAIWSIYRIGTCLKDQRLGLLAGWLLLTTFYFIFWAKTSSADMLNLAGSLFAVCWYFEKKSQPKFSNYAIFFLILAMTSLCKGLVGAVVPLLVIIPDLLMQGEWKKHLRFSLLLAIIPAAIIYVFPFWASSYFSSDSYGQNGLYLVYKENILRYFQPFDHKGSVYTYFIYLPIYLLPWAFFFVPALFSIKSRWREMPASSKWMMWAFLLLFIFFTASGSRRSYYVLPILPFAILLTADWILAGKDTQTTRYVWAGRIAVSFFLLLFVNFNVLQPIYYYQGGINNFAKAVQQAANKLKPWSEWNFAMLDAESKMRFYLQIAPMVKNYDVTGNRDEQTPASLLRAWPVLNDKNKNTIFITRKQYEPLLQTMLANYQIIEVAPSLSERFLKINNPNAPVAFIPKTMG